MLSRIKWPLIALAAFAIGTLDPLSWVFWRAAEWRLPAIKTESLSQPSPFETIPRDKWVAETDNAFVIQDINPQGPVHLLVIPKKRYFSLADAPPAIRAEMINLAVRMAEEHGVAQSGYRLVINTNPQGGQTVYHAHIHIIGGRQMGWLG